VRESDFEHLQAKPESAGCGDGGVAGNQRDYAFFLGRYVRREPNREEVPGDDHHYDIDRDRLWSDFQSAWFF